MKKTILLCGLLISSSAFSQGSDSAKKELAPAPPAPKEKSALKFNLNEDGSRFFQVTFLNQTWLRFNESNEGTMLFGKSAPNTFDIGLRRTRIQMFGQITEHAFLYMQFGQNNFNNTYAYSNSGNRKFAAFFHDAVCEYKVGKGNHLKLGGGLTVTTGVSRFSQPSIGTIMTLDVPVFLQYGVDQNDQFDRKLAVYARGQVGKLDYRMFIANPFPINSNGSAPPAIGKNAVFVNPLVFPANGSNSKNPGINNQYGGYFAWNFFDNENHTTPYMTGTYLGTKKIWNIAIGGTYQKAATWYLKQDTAGGPYVDTTFADMMHLGIETFLDMPLNKDKGTMISAFAGYYSTNYGYNYLRYNGLMNPATGTSATNLVSGSAFGNAIPMFGTGQVAYAQIGYLLPKKLLGDGHGQLMPFASAQYANYQALQNKTMLMFDLGFNWLIKGHTAKLSMDYQNRPTFRLDANGDVQAGSRKSCLIIQYQINI